MEDRKTHGTSLLSRNFFVASSLNGDFFFFFYRYRHYCCFDKPITQNRSRHFASGESNPGFHDDSIRLKKSESNSLEDDVSSSRSEEPVYCEIPEQKGNAYVNCDADSAGSNSGYQELNTADMTSNTPYAKINSYVHPCGVKLAQSEV